MDTNLLSPMNSNVRRSSNAGLPTHTAATRNGTDQKGNKTTDHSHSNGGSRESAKNITAQGTNIHQENAAGTNHAKNNTTSGTQSAQEILVGTGTSLTMRSPTWKSPTKKRVYDR
jgi:hypothetical protein